MFPRSVSEWTINQVKFCDWMQFYDQIYQSEDRPDDKIIEDNDLVDNWFENKIKELERERKKYMAKKKGVGSRSAFDHEDVVTFG